MVEVEDHDRRALPSSTSGAAPRRLEAGDRGVEIAAIEEARQRIADGQLGHVGVEERVGDRESDEAGQDRQCLELVGTEGAVEIAANE